MKNIYILTSLCICLTVCFSCIEEELNTKRTPVYDKIVVDLKWANELNTGDKPILMMWDVNGPIALKQDNQQDIIVADLPELGQYNAMVVTNVDDIDLINFHNYTTIAAQYKNIDALNPTLGRFLVKPLGQIIVKDNFSQFIEAEPIPYVRNLKVNMKLIGDKTTIEKAVFEMSGLADSKKLSTNTLSKTDDLKNLAYSMVVGEAKISTEFNILGAINNLNQNIIFTITAKGATPKRISYNISESLQSILNNSTNADIIINGTIFATYINNEYIYSFHSISLNDDTVTIDEEI